MIKDLSLLGRNLKRVIIIDNIAENFQVQPDNGIVIKSWTGEEHDKALEQLSPLLKSKYNFNQKLGSFLFIIKSATQAVGFFF